MRIKVLKNTEIITSPIDGLPASERAYVEAGTVIKVTDAAVYKKTDYTKFKPKLERLDVLDKIILEFQDYLFVRTDCINIEPVCQSSLPTVTPS